MKKLLLIIAVLMVIPTAMTAQTAKTRQWKGAPSKLSTTTAIGDVNSDGDVNVTDVTLLVGHILGNENSNFIIENADVNDDGDITVTDVTKLVSNILEGNQNGLQLSSYTLSLFYGHHNNLKSLGSIRIISSNGNYTVKSSNVSVAVAEIKSVNWIIVTPTGLGQTEITVTDTKSGQKSTILVSVLECQLCPDDQHPHLIDLGLTSGTKWACCNVGATKPEAYGGYYAWSETEEKDLYRYDTWEHPDEDEIIALNYDIAGTQYDVAHVKWGGSWVLPSNNQFDELISNCYFSVAKVNNIYGGLFTSMNNGKGIFLPGAGTRDMNGLRGEGSGACFWSSNCYEWLDPNKFVGVFMVDYDLNTLWWVNLIIQTDFELPENGHSVRPVSP